MAEKLEQSTGIGVVIGHDESGNALYADTQRVLNFVTDVRASEEAHLFTLISQLRESMKSDLTTGQDSAETEEIWCKVLNQNKIVKSHCSTEQRLLGQVESDKITSGIE